MATKIGKKTRDCLVAVYFLEEKSETGSSMSD